MLNRLDLEHFKCFERLKLPLAPLTLLSGSNASGKSSVLQALVLLQQTMHEHEWSTRLMLNGATIRMGTVSDVVDKVHGRRTFTFGMMYGERNYHWTFTGERPEMSLAINRVEVGGVAHEKPKALRYLLPLNGDETTTALANYLRCLTYITAERVGPREGYSLEDRQIATVVGPQGEHAVSVLHWGRDEHVLEKLAIPGVAMTLQRQVEARMCTLFPGYSVDVRLIPQANAVTLGLRTSEDTDFHRPIHSGFGLSQSLPIVIAALSATEGDILLIENPGVHLHPEGQALMGQFLVDVAGAGIQVIVETHSDHVLNGVRRSVKAGRIDAEQVAIHFFRPRSTDAAQVLTPVLDCSGNIDTWPEGFFDQFDKDMNYFAGWGK